ncbi:putative transmembrane protein [Gregarina niphandrodes]|uniref:Transmembrane protein n=1 Tax=Gregarina niphandrodes TaxID=110365 RepID=A0A023AWP7_GRENI|nr:putative transmembrane protein [Gregarina niphandrodes]EZG43166.1 putative transmembrane protein [Gregarina niphandrodes]|eukprot:XP_011133573.1 putative transmembrane protein [Gregarina niphandrodes]
MRSHHVVFLLELLVTVLFDAIDRELSRRGSAVGSGEVGGGVFGSGANESELPDLSSYHPVFQEVEELKRQLSLLSPSADFVQHSRLGRKLIRVEKEWKDVLKNMEPQERVRHEEVLKPAQTREMPVSRALNVPRVQGHRRWLPGLRVVLLWALAHLVFGWARKLKSMPLFAIPSALFWPLVNSKSGRVYFPASWLLNKIAFDDPALDDPLASVPPIPGGGVLVSLGFATTLYVLNRGYCRLRAGIGNFQRGCQKLPIKQQ